MIRWSYLLSRLAILVVLLVVCHYGMPLAIRWGMIRGWHAATGTAVDVDRVWASVVRGKLRVDGAQFARSYSSRTNFLEFDAAELSLDLGALASHRYVIDTAQIHGIRLDTSRDGDYSPLPARKIVPPDMERLMSGGRALSRRWIDQLVGHLERQIENEFGSIQLVRDLSDQWPAEYEQFEQQVRSCRAAAEQLRTLLASPPALSIDSATLAEWQKRWQEVTRLQDQMVRLRQQLEHLVRQTYEDRLAVEATFSTDREKLRARMSVVRLDGQQLTDYLMASEVYRWWEEVRPYLSVVQSSLGAPDLSHAARRGADIAYDTPLSQPRFLLRFGTLDGHLSLAGQDVAFSGRASNLCAEPDVLGQPARLQLLTQGPFRANMYFEFDKRDDLPRQRLVLQCLGLPVGSRTWGSPDELSLTLAPGKTNVHADVVKLGDEISGRIICAQEHVQLTVMHASLHPRDGNPAAGNPAEGNPAEGDPVDLLMRSLADAAQRVDRFELHVAVSGTLEAPRWEVQSDFGKELEACLHVAAHEALHRYAEQLITQADRRVNAELGKLQEELAGRQAELQQQIGAGEEILSSLVEPLAARIKPLDRLLRRF